MDDQNKKTYSRNISQCYNCAHRQVNGNAFICDVDGVNIHLHAKTTGCPVGKYHHPSDAATILGIPLAGDMVEKIAKKIGADRLAAWLQRVTGKSCGCAERRAKLNAASAALAKYAGRLMGR